MAYFAVVKSPRSLVTTAGSGCSICGVSPEAGQSNDIFANIDDRRISKISMGTGNEQRWAVIFDILPNYMNKDCRMLSVKIENGKTQIAGSYNRDFEVGGADIHRLLLL